MITEQVIVWFARNCKGNSTVNEWFGKGLGIRKLSEKTILMKMNL